MNAYYEITKFLREQLIAEEDINTVTKGDITRIDLNKKNIYPLAHITVNDAGFTTSTLNFGVSVFAMNLRDTRNEPVTDKFIGNDNEDDNLNAMLYVLLRLYLKIEKMGGVFRLNSIQRPEPFTEARNNVVDGWVWRFQIEVDIQDVGAC